MSALAIRVIAHQAATTTTAVVLERFGFAIHPAIAQRIADARNSHARKGSHK